MWIGLLKKARVLVSLIFFLLITWVFIDFTNSLSGKVIQSILYLQFIPSLVYFIEMAGLATAGFVFIIILNLIFGRVYCSSLCPVGTLHDIATWLKRKLTRKKAYKKQKDLRVLKYSILLICTVLLIAGMISPVLLFDPYSNYGRIVANLFRPLYLLLNNLGVLILESMDIYTLYRVEPGVTHWGAVIFSFSVFLVIVGLSLRFGRLFCNSLCPVGTLLGLISRFSYFKISLDQSLCTSCGKCATVCKAGCIDIQERKVDFSRCIACYNCLTSCPSGGVLYSNSRKRQHIEIQDFDPSRRNMLTGSIATALSLAPLGLLSQNRRRYGKRCTSPREVVREFPVSPPGSVSHEHFNNACTACHLCVSACPTHVIKPSFLEYGLTGFMQPRLDYHANYCNFDCVICSEICPTGAIRPVDLEEKHVLQLGKVVFVKLNCIVYTEGTDCGACSEHCPTKAVNMRPYKKNLFLPVVDSDICVGCGACEYACPTDPKSIYVEGNPTHLEAEKPLIEALEQPEKDDGFAF